MTVIHRQLALVDLHPGMVLSDNLLDSHGKILLPKDSVLTQHAINALHRHEVVSVPIIVGELTPEEITAQKTHAASRLARLFRLPSQTEADRLLQHYIRHFRLGE